MGIDRTTRMRGRRAFSLVEVVIALAIVGTIAAIAAPRLAGRMDRAALDAAAARIGREIELVRDRARASSSSATIAFDLGQGRFTVAGVDLSGIGDGSGVIDLSRSPYGITIAAANFGGRTGIEIGPYGTPKRSGAIEIRRGNDSRIVVVSEGGLVSWK